MRKIYTIILISLFILLASSRGLVFQYHGSALFDIIHVYAEGDGGGDGGDGGKIFIEFSPFYAYPTGHHLYGLGFPKGFIPFQFIPIKLTKSIVINSKLKTKDTPEFMFWQFANLNKVSIKQFNSMLKEHNLKKIDERFCISLPNTEIEFNFLKHLPIINELMSMSYSCVLQA